jgi:hypothetical protein
MTFIRSRICLPLSLKSSEFREILLVMCFADFQGSLFLCESAYPKPMAAPTAMPSQTFLLVWFHSVLCIRIFGPPFLFYGDGFSREPANRAGAYRQARTLVCFVT